MSATVNTVLGLVPADRLGVVSVHESLLSVMPGAEHAFDITFDRAAIFGTLAAKLTEFRTRGGGTIVDSLARRGSDEKRGARAPRRAVAETATSHAGV